MADDFCSNSIGDFLQTPRHGFYMTFESGRASTRGWFPRARNNVRSPAIFESRLFAVDLSQTRKYLVRDVDALAGVQHTFGHHQIVVLTLGDLHDDIVYRALQVA